MRILAFAKANPSDPAPSLDGKKREDILADCLLSKADQGHHEEWMDYFLSPFCYVIKYDEYIFFSVKKLVLFFSEVMVL